MVVQFMRRTRQAALNESHRSTHERRRGDRACRSPGRSASVHVDIELAAHVPRADQPARLGAIHRHESEAAGRDESRDHGARRRLLVRRKRHRKRLIQPVAAVARDELRRVLGRRSSTTSNRWLCPESIAVTLAGTSALALSAASTDCSPALPGYGVLGLARIRREPEHRMMAMKNVCGAARRARTRTRSAPL